MSQPAWIDDVAKLPLYFATVREDPLLDVELITEMPNCSRVIMVASGGCTAAFLATNKQIKHLHLVDPNPAQLHLCRLKLHLLQRTKPIDRKKFLGHLPLTREERRRQLTQHCQSLKLDEDCFGPLDFVADVGPDFAGRFEQLLMRLREAFGTETEKLDYLLALEDMEEQQALVDPAQPLGEALDRAFDEVLDLPILVALFGDEAAQNRVEPFARHFARRTRHVLATLPAATSPYLWLMLASRLPDQVNLPWLTAEPRSEIPEIQMSNCFMNEALKDLSAQVDFVHLSNILDWQPPEEAEETLALAWQALRPGGKVFIRQLNSSLDIPELSSRFQWDIERASEMHARDRSFFYRQLHLGQKA